MQERKEVLRNFKLNVFKKLLKQSIIVNEDELMFCVENGELTSCSFTKTTSLMKLWTIDINKLIDIEESNLFEESKQFEISNFEFFIINSKQLDKFLSVHNSDIVDLEFTINEKNIANFIKIKGKTDNETKITTTFNLSSEEFITTKVDDYNEIRNSIKPTEDYKYIFNLDAKSNKELKQLINKLKTLVNDKAYLVFRYNKENNKLIVEDSNFSVEYENASDFDNIPDNYNFYILKSDFQTTGFQSFKIYIKPDSIKILFVSEFENANLTCLTQNLNIENNDIDLTTSNNIIQDLDIEEYIDF